MHYDVLIAGSGLGGLECACMLSKEGMKVCVVEKNDQIGGALQTFRRDKCTFDTSVHYIGGLGEGQNLNRFFNYLDILDGLRLRKYDEDGFDRVLFKDDSVQYKLAQGYDNFAKTLSEYFPKEKQPLRKYCDDIQYICQQFPMYNLSLQAEYGDTTAMRTNTRDYLASLTADKKLQNILAGNALLYAGKPDNTPLHVHALVVNSYIESSWKCVDGSDHIAKLLARNIKANGGTIIKKAAVEKFSVENGRVTHVVLENGEKVYADNFISNIHPVKTLGMIDSPLIRPAFRKRLSSLENSLSAFLVYIVFKKNSFRYRNHNYYIFNNNDAWEAINYTAAKWPESYALFFNGTPEGEEFTDGMAIMTYMRYDEVKQWENTFNTTRHESKRSSDYQQFKKERAEKLIEDAERKIPELKGCTFSYYSATPLSFRDYIGTDDGHMYGFLKDYKDPLKTFILPKTKLPNLFLTGQNINLHGVLGVTVSSVLTCAEIIGKEYLVNKIRNA